MFLGGPGACPNGKFFDFNFPKSPFLDFWVIHTGYWPVPSPRMKPCNLESFLFNISIMKNLTDFRKTVETGVDPRLCALVVQKKFLKKLMSLKRQNFILRYFFWLVCGNLYDSLTYGGAKSTVTRVDSYENKLVSQNALSTHKRGVCSRDAIMGFLSLQYPGKGWVFINP